MAATIEAQVNKFLREQEEARCLAIERERDEKSSTKGKSVKRREIPIWRRAGPAALCQETDLLLMVKEFDFDLSNEDFQSYCQKRGVLHVAGAKNSPRWSFVADWKKSQAAYCEDPHFQFPEAQAGSAHRFSSGDMETSWKLILLSRAAIQDCWELFQNSLITDSSKKP